MATVEWRSPANEMAVQQFDIAASTLNLGFKRGGPIETA